MSGRILHLLSQRPSRTGSGVTMDALVRLAGRAGWRQMELCPHLKEEVVTGCRRIDRFCVLPSFYEGVHLGRGFWAG